MNRVDVTPIDNWQSISKIIKDVEGVKGVSPFIINQVLLTSQNNVSGVVVRGVVPEEELKVTAIEKFMVDGHFKDVAKPGESGKPTIALGKELAASLGVLLGDEVVMVSPFGKKGPFGITPKMKRFEVTGVF